MGFALKKLLSALLMPLPLSVALVALGLWWARSERRRGRGLRLIAAGLGLLVVASLPPVAWSVLRPLEAGQDGYVPGPERPTAIVVLGAGYHPAPRRPLTGQLSGAAVVRVAEGVRVARLLPGVPLRCTGWGGDQPGSNGETACALAVALGVPATRTHAHPEPRDTEEEAESIARVTSGPVVLVTHAGHMPRARRLFERAGVRVLPAPCGHVSTAAPRLRLLPSANALGTTTGAWHEWLGRWWVGLKDLLSPAR